MLLPYTYLLYMHVHNLVHHLAVIKDYHILKTWCVIVAIVLKSTIHFCMLITACQSYKKSNHNRKHFGVSMLRYFNASIYQRLEISMSQYINDLIYKHLYISTPQYINASIFQRLDISTPQYINISIYQHLYPIYHCLDMSTP